MNWLTRMSLKNGAAVILVTLLVTAVGIWSATQLEQETMPDVGVPIVAVMTPYPGAAPSDVLDGVTKPVEDSLASVEGIEHVDSTSAENVSIVVAQFDFSQDMEKAEQQVAEAISRLELPEAAMEPQVSRWSFGSAPVLRVSIANGTLSASELDRLAREELVPGLTGVEGVAQVQVGSDAADAVRVKLLPSKLAEHNMTAEQVRMQLNAANLSFPVGAVQMGDLNKPVRVEGKIESTAALAEMRLMVQSDAAAGIKDAVGQFGTGISQLGQAVTGLGTGLRGAALGLNAQVQLASAMVDTQRAILEAKITQANAQAVLDDDNASAADKTAATSAKATASAQIAGLEATLTSLKSQLSSAQQQLNNSVNAPSATSTGTVPSTTTSASVTTTSGVRLVRLGDISEITVGPGETSSLSRTNGNGSVLLEVFKGQDANTVKVADAVRAKLRELDDDFPAGTDTIYVYDASEAVRSSINGMYQEGLLGALFAFLVILVFLRNFRATIISAVSIPLSLLISMAFIKQAGITLNVITLGGLTVAIGRVVDDSIVVIENTFRRFSNTEERTPALIREATAEVAGAITSSTLTTAAVFVPLGLVSGMVGKIFQPFALTVGLALLASLLVSVTVVPLMARMLLMKSKIRIDVDGDGGAGIRGYRRLLRWSLDHKAFVMFIAIALLAGSVALMPMVGTGFMPEDTQSYVNIDIELPEGTRTAHVDEIARKIERKLATHDAVEGYQTSVGSPSDGSAAFTSRGGHAANIFVSLTEDADVDSVIADMRREYEPLGPDDAVTVTDAGHQIVGGNSSMEVAVFGDDIADVAEAADLLTERLREVDGLAEPENNLGTSKPEIAVEVDQAKAAERALSAGQVAQTVRALLAEETVGETRIDGEKLDLTMGLKLDPVSAISDVQGIDVVNPLGEVVELSQVATVSEVPGPVDIYTRDGIQYAVVRADILDRDTGKVNAAVKETIDLTELPEGVTVEIGGTAEMMSETFGQMGYAMLIAVGLVYLVMVLAFGEATAPLAIMVSLPLASIGAVLGLFAARQTLNMPAMVGGLMLIGLVVTNAIVLVDRVQTNRRERAMTIRDSLIEAGGVRMRPILMTALTTIIALVPLGVGLSEGSLMSQSLAAIVMGGLISSTLLTLVAVPVAYEAFEWLFHSEAREEARARRLAELMPESEEEAEERERSSRPKRERRRLFARKPKAEPEEESFELPEDTEVAFAPAPEPAPDQAMQVTQPIPAITLPEVDERPAPPVPPAWPRPDSRPGPETDPDGGPEEDIA